MARILASLFRDTRHKPQGTLMFEVDRAILAAEAGAEAWREERFCIAECHRHLPPERRGDPLNLGSIAAMLPTWRAWGQILLDASSSPSDTPTRERE
ncbi:hypothetical protein GCM10011611_67450 [Aliidongia dinghuensis]|uniref:Uncharacterized protein n=1 Tax=Aliidongia dinghuensis TaxID=1867774 RepID=A0A8J2Z1F4_9PROT|nr:hypothetical protein [Aliidongia dinghuensis]GGF51480.1 hypothetical protein GCM10011611_67450 [Aliidongia dinghuensis]